MLMFLKHIRSDQGDLSKLLRTGLEWFQLHAGIARPILECPSLDLLLYLEIGWFRTLRKFTCFINAKIHIDNLWVLQTLRANDHALMESFLNTHNFSDTGLCIDPTSAASISEWNSSWKSVTQKATTFDLKSAGKATDHKNCPATSFGHNKCVRSKHLGPYGEAHSS